MASFISCLYILGQTRCSYHLSQYCHLVGSAVLYYMLGAELFQYLDAALFLQPKPVPHREHSKTIILSTERDSFTLVKGQLSVAHLFPPWSEPFSLRQFW